MTSPRARTVAALYVEKGGVYYGLDDVEPWGLPDRDAREYAGPWPVVAHPPCGPWGAFAHLCKRQDPTCATRAVEQVRAFGGVLEHPKNSRLWDATALPEPGWLPDAHGGLTVEVDQLYWGHVAHKRTWLYIVGVRVDATLLRVACPERKPTHDLMGGRGRNARATRDGLLEASNELRRRTPPAFRDLLLSIARTARMPPSEKPRQP